MCSGEIYLFLCVMLSCLIALQHASDCGVQHYHFQGYRYDRRARASSKIVGGSKTFLGEFPWLAMIFYSKSEKNECGGAIINNEFILTAAHCLSGTILNVAGQPLYVRLGEHDIRTNPDCTKMGLCAWDMIEYNIKTSYVYPKYNSRFQTNDIGLIKLASEISFNDFIHPICLPNVNDILVDSFTVFTVSGWGRSETESSSSIKLKAQLPFFDKCQEVYRTKAFGRDQLCAGGEDGIDTCRGDSGGPLMVLTDNKWFVYGIVSHGPSKCGSKGLPGIYTNVSFYSTWIIRKISSELGY